MKKVALFAGFLVVSIAVFLFFALPLSAYGVNVFEVGHVAPAASTRVYFDTPSHATVYFGVCSSGPATDRNLFVVSSGGHVVATNGYYADGSEFATIGRLAFPAGTQSVTLTHVGGTTPTAGYSLAISTSWDKVKAFLDGACGHGYFTPTPIEGTTIRGTVFLDANQNGVFDSGDLPLQGVTVTVSSSGDWSEPFVSGKDGTFAPVALKTGYYTVDLSVPYGYKATTPVRYEGVYVDEETSTGSLGVDFGLIPALIQPEAKKHQPARAGHYYTVQRGDTLSRIAKRYHTTPAALAAANGLSNVNLIHAGQVLLIPKGYSPAPVVTGDHYPVVTTADPYAKPHTSVGKRVHTVRAGENLFRIAKHYRVSLYDLAAANGIADVRVIHVGQQLVIPHY